MSLLNTFKKKKTARKPEKIEKKVEAKVDKPEVVKAAKPKKEAVVSLYQHVLRVPHISEKATDLAESNRYVFKVATKTNKIEIKRAIKDIYGVDVISVRIINIPKKKIRLGRITGARPGYKKAIVRVKKGQKIELSLV